MARESDVVFETVLRLAGRDQQKIEAEISTVRTALAETLGPIDQTLA